jgi:hypothetical protein
VTIVVTGWTEFAIVAWYNDGCVWIVIKRDQKIFKKVTRNTYVIVQETDIRNSFLQSDSRSKVTGV